MKKQGQPKPTLSIALAYVKKHPGRYLFPLAAGRKGKPLIKDNLAQASNDPRQLEAWSKNFGPDIAWGCACKKSGVICLDIDAGPGKVGAASYKALKAEGLAFPPTEVQKTPSGGSHAIYKGEHKFSQSKVAKDIDTPNYFVIAGCERGDGRAYTLYNDKPAADAPEWLVERIKPRTDRPRRERDDDAVPLDWFKRALQATPYTGGPAGLDDRHSYGGWLNFAMACHEAAGGDEADYMWAFIDWSLADPSPDWKAPTSAEYIERKWQSFAGDSSDNAVTRASWFKLLGDIGQGELVAEMIGGTAAADFATDQLTEDDWQSLRDMAEVREPLTFNDFLFSLTDNEFICIPAGSNKFWPAVSVNMTVDGPPTVDPVLEREFRTHEAAKAFAKADAGWAEVERVKVKRPKMTKAATVVMRDRFASGLDIDLDFESPQEPPSDKSSEADPQPALSDAQRRVRRLIVLMGTTPQILRAWLLENGMFMPNESWSAVVRASATAAICGNPKKRVAEITWWPGKPPLLEDTLMRDNGALAIRDTNTFNRYRAPILKPGNYKTPKLWLDHLDLLYPEHREHILQWFAWRVQRPEVKIMHCLVLGGPTRIGKDTLVMPLAYAIGPWNFTTTNAQTIMDEPKFNSYLEGVVCLINEAKDFGDEDRYSFYNRMKPWLGGTATETLMVADKHVRAHPIRDVWGSIITTNHKTRGLYLPPDDERHCFLWTDRTWESWGYATRDELVEKYFKPLRRYYANGGFDEVSHYLSKYPLDENFPMTPPPKTDAWHEVVQAYIDPAETVLGEILDGLGNPAAVTVEEVGRADKEGALGWIGSVARNTIPGAFEEVKYVAFRNPTAKDGKWRVGAKRRPIAIYVQTRLTAAERRTAARAVYEREQAAAEKAASPKPTIFDKPTAQPGA